MPVLCLCSQAHRSLDHFSSAACTFCSLSSFFLHVGDQSVHSISDELLLMLNAEVFIGSLSLLGIPHLMHLLFS